MSKQMIQDLQSLGARLLDALRDSVTVLELLAEDERVADLGLVASNLHSRYKELLTAYTATVVLDYEQAVDEIQIQAPTSPVCTQCGRSWHGPDTYGWTCCEYAAAPDRASALMSQIHRLEIDMRRIATVGTLDDDAKQAAEHIVGIARRAIDLEPKAADVEAVSAGDDVASDVVGGRYGWVW